MSIRKQFISILILFLCTCEWPFNTTPTDKDEIFTLTLTHDIERLVDSAYVQLSWTGITVEEFEKYTIERRMEGDTAWTVRATLKTPLFTSYNAIVFDDENYRYSLSIVSIQCNMKWEEDETILQKTTYLVIQ